MSCRTPDAFSYSPSWCRECTIVRLNYDVTANHRSILKSVIGRQIYPVSIYIYIDIDEAVHFVNL